MLRYPYAPSPSLQKNYLQRGTSLVELLVGITIGLLIVVAALGSLVATQAGSSAATDSARLQQRADFIFRQLGAQLQQAGALKLEQSADPAKLVFSDKYTGFDPADSALASLVGQVISIHGTEGAVGKPMAPDTLRTSYEDSGSVTDVDCLGKRPSTAQAGMDHTFSVANGQLMCKGADSSQPAEAIADGVVDLQISYSVSTALGPPYRYLTADQITAADWSNIQAVNICIELIGELGGQPQIASAEISKCKHNLLASTATIKIPAIDNTGKVHKVFTRSFSLRNNLI